MHSQRRRRVLAVTHSEAVSFAFRLATLAMLLRFRSLEPKRRPRSALAPLQSYLRSRGRCVLALPATSPSTCCLYSRAPSLALCLTISALLLRFRFCRAAAPAATTAARRRWLRPSRCRQRSVTLDSQRYFFLWCQVVVLHRQLLHRSHVGCIRPTAWCASTRAAAGGGGGSSSVVCVFPCLLLVAIVADTHRLFHPKLWDRHLFRRALAAERLAAAPAVVPPVGQRELCPADAALFRFRPLWHSLC